MKHFTVKYLSGNTTITVKIKAFNEEDAHKRAAELFRPTVILERKEK